MAGRTSQFEKDVFSAISQEFPPPQFIAVPTINIKSDSQSKRTADAMVINPWQTRSPFIHGMEIKGSRQDWKLELSNPKKANDVAQFCDYWSIVAPSDVVYESELPKCWGLFTYHQGRGRLTEMVKATRLTTTEQLSPVFLSILSALAQQQRQGTQESLLKAEFHRGCTQGKYDALVWFQWAIDELKEQKKSVCDKLERTLKAGVWGTVEDRVSITEDFVSRFLSCQASNPRAAIAAIEFISKGGLSLLKSKLSMQVRTLQEVADFANSRISEIDDLLSIPDHAPHEGEGNGKPEG